MGWFEVLALMAGPIHPAFICKKEIEKVPFLCGLAKAV